MIHHNSPAIVDEAALHRVLGGPAIMATQLDRVVDACALPNVSVQVIPHSVGAHPALDSTFILLEFAPPVPGVVYIEGLVGQMYLERPQDVARYTQIFERLRTLALSQQQSVDLLAKQSKSFRTG